MPVSVPKPVKISLPVKRPVLKTVTGLSVRFPIVIESTK